ncbi:MAG: RAMP superfamily CRISPR-associated protein, partial [Deltaproteobacteria bacterium]|nr:RAMP superfamily CRISPR-associated protein [Deltaproteobacteria bacterium]
MHYYMNPFEFVPLPVNGPREIPTTVARGTPTLEGYLTYSLTTLTPLHITGKTTKENNHFEKKSFYENYGKKVIPGSSLRGMIASFVEAFTGSDLGAFTRGDEKSKYGKHYDENNAQKCRHVGFLMASADDPIEAKSEPDEYTYRGQTKKRCRYERNETLPPRFGRHIVDDAARFLFGFVDQENEGNEKAKAGRLIFEDLIIPENVKMINPPVWGLKGDAVFGSPNPRANTAWYFTPGESRVRKTDRGFRVWEILADKVRGRKFYFHQDPKACHEEYLKWQRKWLPDLTEYNVEAVESGAAIANGRIYFRDLPETMLTLLAYSLMLPEMNMAHKLGALKPFGFGSVKIEVDGLFYRDMANPLKPIESQGLKGKLVGSLINQVSYRFLKKIMHFPEDGEEKDYLFIYPPFNPGGKTSEEKGFAVVERVYDRHLAPGNVNRSNCSVKLTATSPPGHPTPGKSKKTTLFFDHYQRNAKNFKKVMGG